MTRFTSFVLADSSCRPHEETENHKMKKSCLQRDSNPLSLKFHFLDWRSNRLCECSKRDIVGSYLFEHKKASNNFDTPFKNEIIKIIENWVMISCSILVYFYFYFYIVDLQSGLQFADILARVSTNIRIKR